MPNEYLPSQVSWRTWLNEARSLGTMLSTHGDAGVRAQYEIESTHNYLTEASLYRNFGYWHGGAATLDQACEAMADLLGEAVGMGPGLDVLDAGCGFADQDLRWAATHRPRRILAFDLAPSHVSIARERVAAAELAGIIEVREGSVTQLPVDDETFDRVVALESAFHFTPREAFFREAFRVLRPGGRLALAEPLLDDGALEALATRRVALLRRLAGDSMLAWENLVPRDTYVTQLRAAGYNRVRVHSIRADVYRPFFRYLARRMWHLDILRRVNPLLRGVWLAAVAGSPILERSLDYLIIVADKADPR